MPNSSSRLLRFILRETWDQDPMIGAEIGSRDGRTAELLLATFPELMLVMIDWWQDCGGEHMIKDWRKDLVRAKERTEFAWERRVMIVSDSSSAARHFPDEYFDWIYVDAEHTYEGVLKDLSAWIPKTKIGGLVIGHDYFDCKGREKIGIYKQGVKRGVDEYVAKHGYDLRVRSRQTYQFVRSH